MNVDELRAARANGQRPSAPDANLRDANLYGDEAVRIKAEIESKAAAS